MMENNIVYDNFYLGYQRFHVDNEKGGYLWYCGNLTYYFDFPEITGDDRMNGFYTEELTDTGATFCLDSNNPKVMSPDNNNPFKLDCEKCGCANWTFSYDADSNILTSSLDMAGSQHLLVALTRIGDPPPVTDDEVSSRGACDFDEGGTDSLPVDQSPSASASVATAHKKGNPARGPFLSRKYLPADVTASAVAAAPPPAATNPDTSTDSSYDHCYRINKFSDYQVQWTLDADKELLTLAVSASTEFFGNSTYVAMGFRPRGRESGDEVTAEGTGRHCNFGMQGADIVVGSAGGVQNMYAAVYYGAPIPDSSLKISDGHAEEVAGRMVLSFTRPLVGGYLNVHYNDTTSILSYGADVIYAVGSTNGDSLKYHGHTRGLRYMDWESPDLILAPLKC